ncbi:MAG: NAD(P)-dependent oxidoreductase [Bacteroidia bacterium]|nr:NAD(P)-dependent oxidoreductase [Bacteroidia bacterium]
MSLTGKTVFITGASRGIGLAVAKKLASHGANIAIAAKTAEPHPKLPGTIYTAAEEIEAAGGKALPLIVDVRDEENVIAAVQQTADHFGGIDIVINNASAIQLTGTLETDMKRFDLMTSVNYRGTFLVSKTCIPFLKKSDSPHILNMSPPLNIEKRWFAPHLPYTLAKYGMSFVTFALSEEFKRANICVNSLWPKTAIATAAIGMLGGDAMMRASRKPEIMADAAYHIFTRESRPTGQFFIDEEVLTEAGVTDFDVYAVDPSQALMPDFFI